MPKLLITIREPDGNLFKIQCAGLFPHNEYQLKVINAHPSNAVWEPTVIVFDLKELVKVEAVL